MQKIWVDFQNVSKQGVRLICKGTLDDLSKNEVILSNGLELIIWQDDEDENGKSDNWIVEAIVKYDDEEKCWVAVYEENKLKHESQK